MTRDEIVSYWEFLSMMPEFIDNKEFYLENAIHTLDMEYATALLKAGADPRQFKGLDCLLLFLMHEYQVTRTTRGAKILKVLELLLKYGANPDTVAMNNWRAYDYSVSYELGEFSALILQYGADPKLRKLV